MQETKLKTTLSRSRNPKRKQITQHTLPDIPDKRYFTISEVGHLCALMPHVLRYWETEFSQLKPVKRRGNRRYYQYNDVLMVRQIRKLLYEDGFTIEGARSQLQSNPSEVSKPVKTSAEIKKLIADLEGILQKLKT